MTPLRVLIVEDSEDDMLVLLDTLKSNNYQPTYERVDSATAMKEALQQPWEAIVADYVMPGFGAIAALELLQATEQDIPFIIVSGAVDEDTAVTALKAGAHDFILKSKMARLVPAIERELREAKVRRNHKLAEAALRQSEARYRSLTIATSQAVWTTDALGQIVKDNLSWRVLTGQSEAASKDWGWLEAIHPEDRERTAKVWSEAVDTKSYYQIEHRVKVADGSYRYFLAKGVPLIDDEGNIQEWVGTHTDISDRIAMESALRRRAEELTEANRLKDEFLAVVSHELRSPLNAMLGWTSLLKSRQFDKATFNRALETIERNARSQTHLIDDLLDISRIIRGQMRLEICPVNLIEVIEAAIDTIQPAASAKNISLQIKLDPIARDVAGDKERLQQIIWNLLSNAVKFTPNDGLIQVSLERCHNYIQIVVKDTGIGIEKEFIPQIFDRFRQADSSITRSYNGLGLGLSIAAHLTQLHGGTIGVESPGLEQGSTFTVKLPLLSASTILQEQNIATGDRVI